MSEGPPKPKEIPERAESARQPAQSQPEAAPAPKEKWIRSEGASRKIEAILSIAREMSESKETLTFLGIEAQSYELLKSADEEAPGYTTPIDEILERCKSEGVKVVLGKNSESGNVYILPAHSNDIEQDSISPKHLQIVDGMDERLKKLILLKKS